MVGVKPAPPVVLVVEDEALVRLDVADTLRAAGYKVLQAANADEAIQILARRDDIRLVFTDVDMPGSMDGIKLAHHIAEKWPPVRLLVTSGHIKVSDVDLPEGARFCAKPCPPWAMTAAIAGLLAEAGSPETPR
jgi:CheY-like chemotaxis protein